MLLACLLLNACAVARVGEAPPNFRGGIAADEPRAALLAREALTQGGSAADAAVALYFGMAVLRPSSSGLGAGGVCVAYDPVQKKVQAVDFTPPPDAGAAGAAVPPGAVRGLYAVHGLFGRLRWEQLVGPAEQLARFGAPASRGLAADLAAGPPGGSGAATPFRRADGQPVREGDEIRQPELAAVLGAIRMQGPGALHNGPLAQRFVESVTQAGGGFGVEDLRAAAPRLQDPVTVRAGYRRVQFAPGTTTAGPYGALLFAALQDWRAFDRAGPEERPALLARASAAAYAAVRQGGGPAQADALVAELGSGRPPPAGTGGPYRSDEADRAGTGFVVIDTRGGTVACGLSMGRPFGTGRIAEGTGIFPAARLPAGDVSPALSPVLVMNPNTNIALFAAAGGGTGAATAVADLTAWAMADGEGLDAALARPRVEPLRDEGVLAEPAAVPALQGAARPTASLARVNALFCPGGMPRDPDSCATATDRRGFGLNVSIGP